MTHVILKFVSLDKITAKLFILFITTLLKKLSIKPKCIHTMKKKKKRITLLKSPHVNKKAQEQFELQIFKSFITFKSTNINNILTYLIKNKPKNIKITTDIFT